MTKIEWCDEVWNPVTGCTKVSQGCKHCYAERMAVRLAGRFGYPPAPNQFKVTLHPELLDKPLRWKRPRRVFVNSMSDLFHEDVPDLFIYNIFSRMAQLPQHKFLVLTKRPDRMLEFCSMIQYITVLELPHLQAPNCSLSMNPLKDPIPLPNVWLGVSVEDQKTANERIRWLIKTPAAKRFVSCEPLLAPLDLPMIYNHMIDWVIVGGESGPGARPMEIEWAKWIVKQGQMANVPVFVKQLGGFSDKRNRMGDWPEVLRIREWPE